MNDRRHLLSASSHQRAHLWAISFVILVLAGSQLACGPCGALQKLTSTETFTPTHTSTPAPTPTSLPTSIPTDTPRPTNTPLPTDTPGPTNTPVPTNTPQPTSTPTHTPTPVGYIYEDDFETDRGIWATGADTDSAAEIQDGRISLKVTKAQLVVWNSLNRDLSDFQVTVTAYPQPGVTGYNYGFIFRKENNQNLYLARVSLDGKYALHRYLDGKKTEIVPWTRSDAIQTDVNVLELVCVGSKLNFTVNDTLVFVKEDDSIARGDLGLYVGTGDTPNAEVQFDDFGAYVAQEGDLAKATPTPEYTWADYLYFDLVASQKDYQQIHNWYKTLAGGGSIPCPSQNYAVHRPSYVIPAKLTALRSIYDRYIAAIALVDGTGDEIGPLDRIQLLCKEGKNIGQSDINFDLQKLDQAGPIFGSLIEEVQKYR